MGPRGRAAHAAGALVGYGQDAAPFADHSGNQAGFRQLNTKPTAPAIPCRRRNSSGDKAGIRSAGSGTPAPSRGTVCRPFGRMRRPERSATAPDAPGRPPSGPHAGLRTRSKLPQERDRSGSGTAKLDDLTKAAAESAGAAGAFPKQREYIYKLLQDGQITDEARRRIERELDLEEASIACKREGGEEPPS